MKFKLLFFFSMVVMMQFYSCKRDNQTQLPPLLIPDEMKTYTLFKPGTYWIYQDSISGAIDCVYVTSYDDFQFDHEYDDIGNRTYEQLDMETYSTYEGYFYHYQCNSTFSRNCSISDNYPCYHTDVYKYKPGNYVGIRYDFFYRIVIGIKYYFANNGVIETSDFYNSYSNPWYSFDDVVEMSIENDHIQNYSKTRYLHAKNIGIIRYENVDSSKFWNLIKYNVIQ